MREGRVDRGGFKSEMSEGLNQEREDVKMKIMKRCVRMSMEVKHLNAHSAAYRFL